MVDLYRLYELSNLAREAADLDGDYLEVGTWRGGSSAIVQQARISKEHNGKFYVADTFKGVVKANPAADTIYKGGEHSDAKLEHLDLLYRELKLEKPEILVGIFPDDFININIGKLAFVHIDVDTYESAKSVFYWCLPRFISGSIIVFDDFGFHGCDGVTLLVKELSTKSNLCDKFYTIYNLNGHAILIFK